MPPWRRRFALRSRAENDTENIFTRFHSLDDGLVSYDEVIDGLVVDDEIVRGELVALGRSLRLTSDHLFDHLELAMSAKPVAMALGMRNVAEDGTDDDEEDLDDEVKYHRLYGGLVSSLQR